MMVEEIRSHLEQRLIPFWSSLRDEEYGGFYGYMDYNLRVDREAKKGAILNSRILWFFSSAAEALGREDLSGEAEHAFLFLKERCLDREFGGVFWSVNYDGTPSDTTKHTYNQAFAIYGLSAYYGLRKDPEALEIAMQLFRLIETRMRDRDGYLEAFDREFHPVDNEKLSENGVTAVRTMNTILHVMEAYTELYRVTRDQEVADRLYEILKIVREHIFNSEKRRQEVFFDRDYQSLIDLTSYGHDIEAAWLLTRTAEVLEDDAAIRETRKMAAVLTEAVYEAAYDGRSVVSEMEAGVKKEGRIWWVQAESINGFVDAYQKMPEEKRYLNAAESIWVYIRDNFIDRREGGEWFWSLTTDGIPEKGPIVEPWKCPYHNGRMCLEMIKRNVT